MTTTPPELGHELAPGFGSKEVYERKGNKQKVYMCYTRDSSRFFSMYSIFDKEQHAKKWVKDMNKQGRYDANYLTKTVEHSYSFDDRRSVLV
jgi:hypothetical protein